MANSPIPAVESDATLIAAVQAGDTGMYAVLVRRYERVVRGVVLRKLDDRHLADDVVQETFVTAYESLASLRNDELFGAWLVGIAKRQASRALRDAIKRGADSRDLDSLPVTSAPALSLESSELLEYVERLPEHERVLVGLKHFEGHTAAEVARITGRPIGTVTKQLSRAYARLGEWLSQEAKR